MIWHQTGIVYQARGRAGSSGGCLPGNRLQLMCELGDIARQARTLNQLGSLYKDVLGRLEEAAAFYQQAVNKSVENGDISKEGLYATQSCRYTAEA